MKIIGALFPGRGTPQPKTSFGQTLAQQPPMANSGVGKATLAPPSLAHPPPLPSAGKGKRPAPAPKRSSLTSQPPPLAARGTQQVFSAHQQTTATLSSARASAHQGAAHLQEARVAHHHVATERLDGRLIDLICKELVIEFNADPSTSRVANQDLPLAPPIPLSLVGSVGSAGSERPQPTAELTAARALDGSVRAAQAVELIEKIERFVKESRIPCLALTLNNSLGAKVEIERVGPREVALKVIGHKGPPPAEDIGRIRDEMAAHGLKVSALSVA